MTPDRKRITKAFAMLLSISALAIYVPANSTTQGTQDPTAVQDSRLSAVPLVGRLEVHRGKHIRVDNHDVESGSTILDGQVLETSDCVSATVHLLPVGMIGTRIAEIGQVDIATNSKIIIHYSAGNISASLDHGCSRVRAVTVIETSISTPDGAVIKASGIDNFNRKTAEACYPSNRRETYDPVCVPPIAWVVVGGAAAAAGVVAVGVAPRGDNPSEDQPQP